MRVSSFILTCLVAMSTPPAFSQVAQRYTDTVAENATTFISKRPPIHERLFKSEAIDKEIKRVKKILKDNPRLAWMFENCFPNTLETTVHYRVKDGEDDTFVYTGDIAAMWQRDSGAQVWPYVRFVNGDLQLKRMIRGVILREFKNTNIDRYANAIRNTLLTFREQQRKNGLGPYRFLRVTDRAYDTVGWGGYGSPVKPCGLIVSVFRPSDDATIFPFLIPANFMAVTTLRKAAEILTAVNREANLAKQCNDLADEVEQALKKYAVYNHPKYGNIYALEVDGFGNHLLADDANVPSLLGMGYLGDVSLDDPIYQNTLRFVWSEDNPWFFRGKVGEGIGGPHIGLNMAWPMSIMMKLFISKDDKEIAKYMTMLMHTDAGTGFMHESFDVNDSDHYTRPWFAWQNGLFAELVMKLIDEGKAPLLNSLK